jgi:hypothetical protein
VTTAVILQPSYLPWRGYFHLVARADVFVFYDDVQYDRHGWRNRNRVKTQAGTRWLTVPVLSSGHIEGGLLLRDARIDWRSAWPKKHHATLQQSYARAPFFSRYADLVASFYEGRPERLCDLTIRTTLALAKELGIDGRRFVRSSELGIEGARTDRLVRIVQAVGATRYLSGPSARSYLDEGAFARAGIALEYMVYAYPEYEQLHPPFDGAVTVLDLLFMAGPRAPELVWGGPAR